MKRTSVCPGTTSNSLVYVSVASTKERSPDSEKIYQETLAKNFWDLMETINLQMQEAKKKKFNLKNYNFKSYAKHIIIK